LKKKIYFRTRGGFRQGWGNIYRLITIYNFFKKTYDCLLIYEGNKEITSYIKKLKINSLKLKSDLSLDEEEKIIKKLEPSSLTILEMLECTYSRQKIYKKYTNKLIVLDDILKNKYCADLVISAQYKSKKKNIKNLYTGYEYYPLRNEFQKFFKKKKTINKKVNDIVVCLGGSSYKLANQKIINYFKTKEYKVTFILGSENDSLYKTNKNRHKNIFVKKNVKNLSRFIFNCDLFISGGGYTKIECAYLQTPMIVFPVQKHQQELIEDFKKYCGVPYLPLPTNLRHQDLEKILRKYNYKFRIKMNKNLINKFTVNNFKEKMLKILISN
tara:strand:- start:16934 stop:17914 length:981 start_codon:yes stop_codon:yes gene_type:complete